MAPGLELELSFMARAACIPVLLRVGTVHPCGVSVPGKHAVCHGAHTVHPQEQRCGCREVRVPDGRCAQPSHRCAGGELGSVTMETVAGPGAARVCTSPVDLT